MDHACHRCGANVSEGTPFCAQCGAPQIRVNTESAGPLPALADGTVPPPLPHFHANTEGPRVQWSAALPRALAGAVVLVLLSMVAAQSGSLLLLVLMVILSGVFSVWLYVRKPGIGLVTGSMGAMIGLVAGFFASLAMSGLVVFAFLVNRAGTLDQVRTALQQQAARNPNPDPQAQKMMEGMINNPEGLTGMIAVGLLMSLIFLVAFSTVGGALGAMLFRKR